ncbi:Sensor protein kinase WalK [Pseudoruegeria aquimaris]|uniref:histidine kinase n=1 Tax=Pseudoruegeria aquimaris TaxID=393663 RepID=A0A1Y5RKD0_9RHOB|nr:PAS domain-containing sensor histidine kinase [Pseudoruegeria aquimaris]SLN18411.1 Sensor protein kinase WalK [Pseudoruegeria aquimaris]
MRLQRRVQTVSTFALVALGPVLALATILILGPMGQGGSSNALRLILLTDLVYILLVAALVIQRVAQMIAARRAKSAGSRLHLRLTGVFGLLALIPTVLVAVFAVLTVNVGLEGWFSDRVRNVVGNSLAAAQAYENEHREDLIADARSLAAYITAARLADPGVTDGELRELLSQGQALVQRGLREAYLIDGTAELRARGERSYLFNYDPPTPEEIARAAQGEIVVIRDWDNNEFRVLMRLGGFLDRYLYVSRDVDGDILSLLDETKETVLLYQQQEAERGRILFDFGLLYLGFAMILILAAVWLGLWFAERLSRPVGRLAGAAQRVGAGDLDLRVVEEKGDDEIAMLGRYFNQMTRQLKLQRENLLETNRQIERRRRLFDSVLSSVTAGVVGLDAEGKVTLVNRSAMRLLGLTEEGDTPQDITLLVPEFGALFATLREEGREVAQEEIKILRDGKQENLLVRFATRRNEEGRLEGYVVTFDDVTDLVTAQRMAAWGDVARRIAHEIKNPLTPIQLSAERIRRKFAPKVGDEAEALEQMTEVIVRQTNDLRRIVDEFSKFARMPEPERKLTDVGALVKGAVLLQNEAVDGVRVTLEAPDHPIWMQVDGTMISQALTNLIKNAAEATETYKEKHDDPAYRGAVRVCARIAQDGLIIEIADNGIGLPADRAKLFEPYVTTRDKGTGLGLPIVKKIIEEHGGSLKLQDAEPFEGCTHRGACAVIFLPGPFETTHKEKDVSMYEVSNG